MAGAHEEGRDDLVHELENPVAIDDEAPLQRLGVVVLPEQEVGHTLPGSHRVGLPAFHSKPLLPACLRGH